MLMAYDYDFSASKAIHGRPRLVTSSLPVHADVILPGDLLRLRPFAMSRKIGAAHAHFRHDDSHHATVSALAGARFDDAEAISR